VPVEIGGSLAAAEEQLADVVVADVQGCQDAGRQHGA
jgi:hypothetical protein